MNAAYLYPQLEKLEEINDKRQILWDKYHKAFEKFEANGLIRRPYIPKHCKHNAHMYFLRFKDLKTRTEFIDFMNKCNISTVFHYIPLHSSPAGLKHGRFEGNMEVTNKVSDTLVRLPLFYSLETSQQDYVIEKVSDFLNDAKH